MKSETCAACALSIFLVVMVATLTGCEPEMPVPPPKTFGSSAEEDFDWAMERMKHAIELFRPASGLGLSVKREMDYELFPPSKTEAKYTARVTISNRAVFRSESSSSEALRRRAAAKKEASKIKLDNPFKIPGEEKIDDGVPMPEIPVAEIEEPEIANPRIPTQQLKEKKDYFLEYVDGQWRLKTEDLDESEQMWFDYALEQGEFAPDAAGNR